jgi:hypothetical protein
MRQRCLLIILYEPGRVWQNMETNTYRTLMAELWKHDRHDMVWYIYMMEISTHFACIHRYNERVCALIIVIHACITNGIMCTE